jgi:hypothetical protein
MAPRNFVIRLNQIARTEQVVADHTITVPNDTPLEELLKPGAYVEVHRLLSAGGILHVRSQDYELDMDLRVLKVENSLVFTRSIRIYESPDRKAAMKSSQEAAAAVAIADATIPPVPEGYKVGHRPNGAEKGHYAQLMATSAFIASGLSNRRAAVMAAIDHAKKAGTYVEPQPATPAPAAEAVPAA